MDEIDHPMRHALDVIEVVHLVAIAVLDGQHVDEVAHRFPSSSTLRIASVIRTSAGQTKSDTRTTADRGDASGSRNSFRPRRSCLRTCTSSSLTSLENLECRAPLAPRLGPARQVVPPRD